MNVPALLTTLGGALLLGGGVGLAVLARNAGDDLDEGCATTATGTYCPESLAGEVDRERRASFAADGLFVAGAVAVVVGVVLFVRGGDEDDTEGETPQVDAWVGPGGGGMQVRGAF